MKLQNKRLGQDGPDLRISMMLAIVAVTLVAVAIQRFLVLSPLLPLKVMLVSLGGAGLIDFFAGKYLNSARFGAANRVTLIRAALTGMLLVMVGEDPQPGLSAIAAATAFIALLLDGLDGWLARRQSEVSDFGARFDMETDALLICVIAAMVWQHEKAGPWVLAGGLMRYAFVACSYALPWMRRKLPDSYRRKVVCVAQTLSLILALSPTAPSPLSDAIAFTGLALLTFSFGIDLAWLFSTRADSGRTRGAALRSLSAESNNLTVD